MVTALITVAALAWLFERPLEQRPATLIGLLCGLLPVLYLGFAPLAAIVLLTWALGALLGVSGAA